MSKLVQELKGDHEKLAQVLSNALSKGPTKEGLQLLTTTKAALLAHLKKEDTFLYPELKKAAVTDKHLKSTIDMFAADMDKISKAAVDFFNKWEKGGDGVEFAKDIGSLISALRSRIHREESALYPEFDKIADKKAA
jgi:iron-sulfur cluster repair protein YtfE (RIC family)